MKTFSLLLILLSTLVGCADTTAPTWADDAQVKLSLDENTVFVQWPQAGDDKGVAHYRVLVDGNTGVETGAEGRNWKAIEVSVGADHAIAVVAIDEAGNESAPLETKWDARDIEGPTWPTGAYVQVSVVEPPAQGDTVTDDTKQKLRIQWPDAEDPAGIDYYRVLVLPTGPSSELARPRLVAMVREGDNDIEAEGTATTMFEIYAVDKADNSSKPLKGALKDPRRFDPTKKIPVDPSRIGTSKESPPIDAPAGAVPPTDK